MQNRENQRIFQAFSQDFAWRAELQNVSLEGAVATGGSGGSGVSESAGPRKASLQPAGSLLPKTRENRK
jgi:hypothetical protein